MLVLLGNENAIDNVAKYRNVDELTDDEVLARADADPKVALMLAPDINNPAHAAYDPSHPDYGVKADVATLRDRLAAVQEPKPLPGRRITSIGVPAGVATPEAFVTITSATGVWANHAAQVEVTEDVVVETGIDDDGNTWERKESQIRLVPSTPAWVESDSPALAQLLAEHYGCPIGRPDGWEVEA